MRHLVSFILCGMLAIAPLFAQPQTGEKNKVDEQGRKQGYWVKLNGDTLKYEGNFVDDIPVGQFRYFYPDKSVKSIVQYSEKGLMAKTVNYYPSGKKRAEGEYWDKKKHGLWKYFNETEQLLMVEDYHYGVPEGEWITYFTDGKPVSIKHYSNGQLNGTFVDFFPDSLINIKGTYKDGKMNGMIYYYYMNGKVMISGNYLDDRKDGVWMYFNEVGQADKRMTYTNGNLIREEITVTGPDKKIMYIDIDKIAYIFNEEGVVKIRMKDATDYPTDRKIEDFQHILNEYKFYRVNANYFISLWSLTNRKTYDPSQRLLVLNPASPAEVYVADAYAEGFLHWANLIPGEVDPKNPRE